MTVVYTLTKSQESNATAQKTTSSKPVKKCFILQSFPQINCQQSWFLSVCIQTGRSQETLFRKPFHGLNRPLTAAKIDVTKKR